MQDLFRAFRHFQLLDYTTSNCILNLRQQYKSNLHIWWQQGPSAWLLPILTFHWNQQLGKTCQKMALFLNYEQAIEEWHECLVSKMYAVKIGASPEHVWVNRKSYENCNFFWRRAKSSCFGHQKLWKVQIGINSQNSFGQCWWISRKLRLFHNFCVQDPPASSKKGEIHQVSSWGSYASGQKCDQNRKVDNHNLICIDAIFSVEVSLMRLIEGIVQQFGVVTKCCVS